jgi:hypothetical protein
VIKGRKTASIIREVTNKLNFFRRESCRKKAVWENLAEKKEKQWGCGNVDWI